MNFKKEADLKLASEILNNVLKAGAGEAEVFLFREESALVEISNQVMDTLQFSSNSGVGTRIVVDDRLGFAYSSDFHKNVLLDMGKRAVANASNSSPDSYNILPSPAKKYPHLSLFDAEVSHKPVKERIEMAERVEKGARSIDPRITITEACGYQDAVYMVSLVNSHGIAVSYEASYAAVFAHVVAEEDSEMETGFDFQHSRGLKDLLPEEVGQSAAKKALRLLKAHRVSTQKVPVVLEPYVASALLGTFIPAWTADSVQKGKSLFINKLGKKIASPKVTIIDHGSMEEGVFSAPFDGEGMPTSRTILINKGYLENYLYDTYTALRDNTRSTGNAVRSSFRGLPEVGATNFYIKPEALEPEELIKQLNTGFYVTSFMGLHTANPISGDFSLGAEGIWIENGELSYSVRGVTIAGNLLEMLEKIEAIGSDLKFYGTRGSPTLVIDSVTISGD